MTPNYEAWRPALIAFIQAESPWMATTLEALKRGDQMTNDNRRMIDALIVAGERMPRAA